MKCHRFAMFVVLAAQLIILLHDAIPHHHHTEDMMGLEHSACNGGHCCDYGPCISEFIPNQSLVFSDFSPAVADAIISVLPEPVCCPVIETEAERLEILPAGVFTDDFGLRAPPVA